MFTPLQESIIGRAVKSEKLQVVITDIRDYTQNKHRKCDDTPFGGGAGGGVTVTPIAFLIVKEGNVRMLPVAAPANTTADRIVEQVPDVLDKIASFIDSRTEK